MNVPVHRHTDSRSCGAATTVTGQSTVYVNNLLASVQGDPNTHSGGALSASVNDGTVFVNNKKLVLKGSSASSDALCPPLGQPHCNPKSVGASGNVFACGGGPGAGGGGYTHADEKGNDPSRSDLYPDPNAEAPEPVPNVEQSKSESDFDTSGFSEADQARIAELENDPDWQREMEAIEARYPNLDRAEIYKIIKGESSFKRDALNPDSGAAGYFQFIEPSARDLGLTPDQIRRQTPAQQLNTYGKYLDRWSLNENNTGLGIMQAAPAYANKPPNFVLPNSYAIGGKAWTQNPGWRTSKTGPITVQSINDYYSRQG